MIRVCHFFDASAGWEQRVAASQLVSQLPDDGFDSRLAAVAPGISDTLGKIGKRIHVFATLPRLALMAAPILARHVRKNRVNIVHAWGIEAAFVARAAGQTPFIVELFDPSLPAHQIKLLRTLARKKSFAVICSCRTVYHRLLEGGVPQETCVVIRPGVDFAAINRHKDNGYRKDLSIGDDDFVVIVPEPVTRTGGQFDAFWAAKLTNIVDGNMKIIIPGESPEQRRIVRFARTLPEAEVLVAPGCRYPFERLLTGADALVVAATSDISTTAISWAMASNVPVIASTVHSVAELISHGENGLLFERNPGETPAAAIAQLLRDRSRLAQAEEVASRQAYRVFGLRRYLEQHMQVYDNVLAGTAAGQGIIDFALAE
ncbi:MAG: glycosyltransferase family 4 protein [Phycisphaerales bacterium]|nr:MAG: glycosyltransferase family 4 protein [Phycisphaerales bacterium]